MAARQGCRGPDAPSMATDRAARVEVRRAAADRQPTGHHDGDAESRSLVLPELVSAGLSGGDCGRRLRSGDDRGADQEAFLRAQNAGESPEAPGADGSAEQGATD